MYNGSMVPCACGCGEMFDPVDSRGRPRKYIRDHQTRSLVLCRTRPYPPSPTKGTKASQETIEKLRISHAGQEPWNKGKKGPPAWNKGLLGVTSHSIETRKRISATLKAKRETSHLWRGGVPRGPYERLNEVEWKALRKTIYERDNWSCVICSAACGNSIQCHHILPVKSGGSDDPTNLATLCKSCHKRQDNLFGTDKYFWNQ
jgi:5-methylcytosine-specific restriction endonuclease McrA